ncbi:hypothetical protein Ga0074812_108289 [Parafrankia irregularis]|uniref:Uncharacterized protein n=1 Tax=Parafrankia irregularis TaxID=795642 RepID=A0A0S4QNG2_9ACTN|nr:MULTISPECIES: hypothetical protein [Parafrankia]MBE3200052.1 hypothetical protein [Parafrankia sp. CH37]CUU56761.1 hypothetical protein Ga0074812_108289 [Parafrankia irregularis]
MIEHGWRTDLSAREAAELASLLAEAAREDEETGYLQAGITEPLPPGTTQLLVWMSGEGGRGRWMSTPASAASASATAAAAVPPPALAPPPAPAPAPVLAAYLRIEPAGSGQAVARYVVRPALRSLGVTTLLLEELGPFGGPGWAGGVSALDAAQLRIWAQGGHPAAARVARRFRRLGVEVNDRRWWLLADLRAAVDGDRPLPRPADGAATPARPPATDRERARAADLWQASATSSPPSGGELLVVPTDGEVAGAIWFDPGPVERTEYGTAGRIEGLAVAGAAARPGTVRGQLLRAAMERMAGRHRMAAVIVVPAAESPLVTSARLAGFEHRRTDVEYMFADRPAAPGISTTAAGEQAGLCSALAGPALPRPKT